MTQQIEVNIALGDCFWLFLKLLSNLLDQIQNLVP